MDVEDLIRQFPLVEHPDSAKEIRTLAGPFDLAIISQLQRQQGGTETEPVDYFLFELGQPPDRHTTKIGGLPYRPAGKPWPVCDGPFKPSLADLMPPAGSPMLFVGQICFADSHDLLRDELPGDVLLFFTEDDSFCNDWRLEWYSLGLSDLTEVNESPASDPEFVTCFGHRVRASEPSVELEGDVSRTKIGGQPDYLGDTYLKGQYICQLGSVGPTYGFPAPWIGQEEPTTYDPDNPDELNIVDGGTLFVLKTESGFGVELHSF